MWKFWPAGLVFLLNSNFSGHKCPARSSKLLVASRVLLILLKSRYYLQHAPQSSAITEENWISELQTFFGLTINNFMLSRL